LFHHYINNVDGINHLAGSGQVNFVLFWVQVRKISPQNRKSQIFQINRFGSGQKVHELKTRSASTIFTAGQKVSVCSGQVGSGKIVREFWKHTRVFVCYQLFNTSMDDKVPSGEIKPDSTYTLGRCLRYWNAGKVMRISSCFYTRQGQNKINELALIKTK